MKMRLWLKRNYFWQNREWVYKDIKPKIIAEKYLNEDLKNDFLTDYKFYCFNGKAEYCQVIKRSHSNGYTTDFFDSSWNHMPFIGLNPTTKHFPGIIKKPKKYKKMLFLSNNLSNGFPFVRVDFYYIQNKIIFGELTFFPLSGYGKFQPDEWNFKMGDLLKLPNI